MGRRVHGESSSSLGGVQHTLEKPAPRSCKDARLHFSCFPHCPLPGRCSPRWGQRCLLCQLPILWSITCGDPPGSWWGCYPCSSESCEAPTLPCLHCQPPVVPGLDVHAAALNAQLARMGVPAGQPAHMAALARVEQQQAEIIAIQKSLV